jgi:hypothetical protein
MPRVAWKSFTEGRALARGLELKGHRGWTEWSKSGQRSSDIPTHPNRTYRDDGWISWPDWLGNGKERVAFKSFTEGRELARGLELKSVRGWKEWSKSGQRPSDIPSSPHKTYRDVGWISWPNWLGNGKQRVAWKSFTEGRAVARGLGLKRQEEWQAWSKSGQRPSSIPAHPERAYRDAGWVSYPDWLGYGSEGGAAAASRSSSSSSSATTAPKKKKMKKKRKRRPATTHPSDLPPPPPPSTSPSKPTVKTEPPSSKSGGGGSDRSTEPPLRKIKKEEERADDDTKKQDDRSGNSSSSSSSSSGDAPSLSATSVPPHVKVEEIGGFSIVSSASDLKHTACGLLQHGPPTS